MAESSNGRHRADVEVKLFEQIELRSRRSIREAERAQKSVKKSRAEKRQAKLAKQVVEPVASAETNLSRSVVSAAKPKVRFSKRRDVRSAITMLTSAGIFTTIALPSYAFSPKEAAMAQFVTSTSSTDDGSQSYTAAQRALAKFDRIQAKSLSSDELKRQQLLNSYRSYSGPSAADFVKNPPYSSLDGATILKVAEKYVGTPYVFGGENPSGFDCSGYVAYVFAHFGIALPHSVNGQSRMGIIIHKQDARPGDIVVLNDLSHDGIYAGDGMFYHAPRPGDTVKLAPIFTDNYFIVRLKTK